MPYTICIDFDGVLHSYKSEWQGADCISDPPVPGAIEWLDTLCRDDDIEVCIYSSRSSQNGGIEAMKAWLWKYRMPTVTFDRLKFPFKKPAAFLTIDDRCICFNGTWPTIEAMKSFQPWWKKDA